MIITEYFKTRSDGVILNRTYSDKQMMIERDGVLYSEAIDPIEMERVYVETDIPIDVDSIIGGLYDSINTIDSESVV